jgi:hypothetical protein
VCVCVSDCVGSTACAGREEEDRHYLIRHLTGPPEYCTQYVPPKFGLQSCLKTEQGRQ